MAKPLIDTIDTSQTFQDWLTKTNDIVEIIQSDALTASVGGGGDTTNGDATLLGTFTATNITASTLLSSDTISAATGGDPITFQSPFEVASSQEVAITMTNGSGVKTRFTTGATSWDVGILDGTTPSFIINTGVDPKKFVLTSAGTLTVPNLNVLEDIDVDTIRCANYLDENGDPFESGTVINQLSDIGDVSTTAPSNGEVLKWNGTAWAPAADNVGTATSGIQNVVEDTTPELGGNLNLNGKNITGAGNITLTNGSISASGNVDAVNIRASGDIVTAYSGSDIALKENLQIINNPLDKVQQVNGYTFNYIDKPEETLAGVVAQEIEKVLPGVVYDHERNNGTYKAVRYDNIIPLLIEAIKELKGKVDDLESRLQSNGN